ncbi:MAG TPA: cupin domain-containing protein [Actinomycetota bacterium]|nr:cupin domain-containing protein [Actinomycetota bacterium]
MSAAALERCVVDVPAFLADDWGRRPTHRAGGGAFDDLLSLADVDHLLTGASLRLPAFRLVKEGATLPTAGYTKSGRTGSQPVTGMADPARILERFRDGATIVLQGLHRYWPALGRFCRELEASLGHPAQVNAYITPPGSQGLAVHQDTHDVFVLQSFGRKQWDVWEPRPLGAPKPEEDEEPVLSVTMEPGDAMYLPLGTPHAASTQTVLSGHLTIGILTVTWAQLFAEVLGEVGSEFAEALPAGYHRDPDGFATAVKERLADLQRRLDDVDARAVADRRIRSFLTTRLPSLGGALEDLVRLDSVDDGTLLRRRPASFCEVRVEGPEVVAFLGDRELRMPGRVEGALRFIAARDEPFRPADIPGLDEAGRVVLARRLVREGTLELAG